MASLNLKPCAGNPSQRDHLLLCLPLAESCAITKDPIGKQTYCLRRLRRAASLNAETSIVGSVLQYDMS